MPKKQRAKSEYTLTVRQWDRTKKSDAEWHLKEFPRIGQMIADGYHSGEIVGDDGERGWWELSEGASPTGDPWSDDPTFGAEDWRAEVANGDTRRGYLDWVAAKREEAEG